MANNRLWAVCRADNWCKVLLKNYGDWYCVGEEGDHNDFFLKHKDCDGNNGCGENVVFVTEVDDPQVEWYDFRRPGEPRIYLKGNPNNPPRP